MANNTQNQNTRSFVRRQGPSLLVKFLVSKKEITTIQLVQAIGTTGLEWEIIGPHSPILEEMIEKWLDSYIKKRQPDVSLPIILDGLPPYTTRVLSILRDIPFGVSLTYKELAEITGSPRGARAVGNACARNPFPLIIPCHRVLATDQKLGGFSCGLDIKKALLSFEGNY